MYCAYFMLTVERTLRTKSRCKPPHLSRNPAYAEWKVRNIRKGKLNEGENGTSESWASVRRRSDGVIISALLITQLPLGYFFNNWGFTDVRPLPTTHGHCWTSLDSLGNSGRSGCTRVFCYFHGFGLK